MATNTVKQSTLDKGFASGGLQLIPGTSLGPGLQYESGPSITPSRVQEIIRGGRNAINSANKTLNSIYSGAVTPTVYAPNLDIAAVNASARKSAEAAANPYYSKLLKNFLSRQAFQNKTKKAQYQTNIQNIQDELAQTLEGNEITKTRTGEDANLEQQQINTVADQQQTDQGQDFDAARLELAKNSSTGGIGRQQVEAADEQNRVQESRQAQEAQRNREQVELFKTRSFSDLARSSKLAKGSAKKAKKQEKFDLDTYIKTSKLDERDKRDELEKIRQDDITAKAAQFARDQYNQYLRNISDPAQRVAAAQQYGSSF